MPKAVRIVPEIESPAGQSITFMLAIGPVRQMCRLQTTLQTEKQASSYLQKHRKEFERVARERFARGEIDDGVVHLTMF
ncbi:hypothetical protein QA641_31020 [Bradyrhizobium sp. CB1650]|uniref:hypothetical protein n=1 Tax=Bradyrhizobium sp. CB1650 TaxID=3039153 RepID=UPI002434E14B|nr:hypothetical protein [Bradyrhizobium sp. CB1650]WGD50041.1 hypothetical protein QA641_31020 [Bradyrhizobium sp. CB1650]